MDKIMKARIEEETAAVAKELGGGWVWNMDVVTNIVLTLPEAKALVARLPPGPEFKSPTDELHYNLVRAERHTSQAMNVLYRLKDPANRSIWFRMALGRAQNILMSIYVRDIRHYKP